MPRDGHRSHLLGSGTALVVIGAALVLSACSETSGSTPASPSSTSASSTPSATTSDTDAAVAAATTAARSYYVETGRLFADPQTSLDGAATVAGGDELDQLRRQVQERRVRGELQAGTAALTSITAISADLQDPASVDLDVCVDVSGIDVKDAAGQSVISSARPATSVVHMTVVDRGDRGWLVEATDQSGEPCTS